MYLYTLYNNILSIHDDDKVSVVKPRKTLLNNPTKKQIDHIKIRPAYFFIRES